MVLRTSIENGATMNLDLEWLSTNIGWVRSFFPFFYSAFEKYSDNLPLESGEEKKKKETRGP